MKGKYVYCGVHAEVVQEIGQVTHKHHVIKVTRSQVLTTCDKHMLKSGKQDWLSSWQYGVRNPLIYRQNLMANLCTNSGELTSLL